MNITPPHILRIKRPDAIGEYVLLHITSSGASPLDLKLVATEQEHLYHCITRESSVKSLQAERYAGSLEQFKTILKSVLLGKTPNGDSSVSDVRNIEITATIDTDTLTLNFHQNTSGIKSAIASIDCVQDDEREVVSFPEWVGIAVAASDDAREECRAFKVALSAAHDLTSSLTAQLDALVQAKEAHESDLLNKFAALLNAKKLKIRDQQRLLAGAEVDPAAKQAISESRGASSSKEPASKTKRRPARSSRASKRKANDQDGDEDMGSAKSPETDTDDDQLDRVERETPPRSENEDVAAVDAFEAARPPSRNPTRVRTTSNATEMSQTEGYQLPTNKEGNLASSVRQDKIPPPRTLPFRKQTDATLADATAEGFPDDDDDEDEDEI